MYCMTLQRTARTGRVKIESLVINREFSQDVIKVFSQRKIVLNSWYIFSLSGSSNVVLVLINASSLLWACQLEMEKYTMTLCQLLRSTVVLVLSQFCEEKLKVYQNANQSLLLCLKEEEKKKDNLIKRLREIIHSDESNFM